jgi:hypothetical protein
MPTPKISANHRVSKVFGFINRVNVRYNYYELLESTQRCMKTLKRIALLVLMILSVTLSATLHAGVVEDLKAMAVGFHMEYLGTTDRFGKAYYMFGDTQNSLVVVVPADVRTTDEASICFQSGWGSAWCTWDYNENYKTPAAQKPHTIH